MEVIVNVSYKTKDSVMGFSFAEESPNLTQSQFQEVAMDILKSNYSREKAEQGKSMEVIIHTSNIPRKRLAYAFMSVSERLKQDD